MVGKESTLLATSTQLIWPQKLLLQNPLSAKCTLRVHKLLHAIHLQSASLAVLGCSSCSVLFLPFQADHLSIPPRCFSFPLLFLFGNNIFLLSGFFYQCTWRWHFFCSLPPFSDSINPDAFSFSSSPFLASSIVTTFKAILLSLAQFP